MTDTPTAIFVTTHDGPEVMQLQPHDPGQPGRGQVRVHTSAAGVNFIDTYQRTGRYPGTPPFVLGLEGAGVVQAVGPDVEASPRAITSPGRPFPALMQPPSSPPPTA